LEELQQTQADMRTQFDDHRKSLEDEINRLRGRCEDLTEALSHGRDKVEHLEAQFDRQRTDLEQAHRLQLSSERQISHLTNDKEALQKSLDEAIQEDLARTREVDTLKFELARMNSEHQELKNLEEQNAARVTGLLNDQQVTLRNLEEARSRGENLESQIRAALMEGNEARRSLEEANEEKERLLRLQAGEQDRRLRDQIAEADGDRAVWEHQFSALRTELESTRSTLDAANADLAGQREEHERTIYELRESRRRESALRTDFDHARAAFSEHETRHERDSRLVAELLQVSINYRQAISKAVSIANSASLYPTKAQQSGLGLADSVLSMPLSPSNNTTTRTLLMNSNSSEDIPLIDPSEPDLALETLRELDLDACLDALSKPVSALRKWQKQCKDYRERAKGKITFRNFSRGDLALFLPIKNSVQKPWAAFNSTIHHFFFR
jgi:autophagy-related protein 11